MLSQFLLRNLVKISKNNAKIFRNLLTKLSLKIYKIKICKHFLSLIQSKWNKFKILANLLNIKALKCKLYLIKTAFNLKNYTEMKFIV
jgi:hypothetical protein